MVLTNIKPIAQRGIKRVALLITALISVISPLAFYAEANAGPSFSEYPLTAPNIPYAITTTPGTNGSMWYSQADASTGRSSIANISSSGAITDYNIVPSGYTNISLGSIAADQNGNIWFHGCGVTPTEAYLVLGKLDTSTGAVSLTPRTTRCSSTPGPITISQNGNVWAATSYRSAGWSSIERFNSSGAYLDYYSLPYADYVDSFATGNSNTLWFTSTNSKKIYKLNLSPSGTVASRDVFTPSNYPIGITLGPDGNMWFTENGPQQSVGKITPTGTITDYPVGTGNDLTNIATGSDGALWFTIKYGDSIGRITISGLVTTYAIPTAGGNPLGITSGSDGAIWFTEIGSRKIGRIPATPFFSEYSTTTNYTPKAIVTTPGTNGSMWYVEVNSSTTQYSIGNITSSGTVTDYNIVPSGYTNVNISSIAADQSGNVWFGACVTSSSASYSALGRLDTSSGTVSLIPHGGQGCVNGIMSIAIDQGGNIWAVMLNSLTEQVSVSRFNSLGTYLDYYGLPRGTTSIATGLNNTLWLTGRRDNAIYKLTLSSSGTVASRDTYTIPTISSSPSSLTLGTDDNMWFIENSAFKVAKITSTGTITEYASPSGSSPMNMAAGSDGAIWITDFYNKLIRITTTGTITTYSTPSSSGYLQGITSGSDGAIWFTNPGAKTIGRFGY